MSSPNTPISGTFGGIITGTYDVPGSTTDTVVYAGATFGNGPIAELDGPGTLDSSGPVSINHEGGDVQLLLDDGITWDNSGAITQGGEVQFGNAAGDSAAIINDDGAVYDLTTGDSQLIAPNTGTYSFVNAGLLEDNGGGNDTISVALTNSGEVTANNGNLYLAEPIDNSGTLTTGGGLMLVEGGVLGGTIEGNVFLIGTYTVAIDTTDSVAFSGATLGDGAVAVLDGPGTLLSNGQVNVNHFGGNVQLELTGGITLENAGVIDQGGGVQFGASSGDSATIVNQAGATYDLTTSDSDLPIDGAGTYSFVNAGLLLDNGGGNDTIAAPVSNSGVVNANNGNLFLTGPIGNSGTLTTSGGFLEIEGGVLGGTIEGNVALIDTYTSAIDTTDTVMFAGASLGNGTAATLTGPGILVSNGQVNVTHSGGNVQLVLNGGIELDNAGVFDQGGALQFGSTAGDSATIVNQAGATYDLTTGDSQMDIGAAGTYGFVNAGLLEMTGGGDDTIAVPLSNSGIVTANNGNFYLAGAVGNSGTLTTSGGFIQVEGGVLGGLIQGNIALIGTYTSAIDTTVSVVFGGATLGNGAVAVLAGPGTLASTGIVNVTHSGGNVQLELTGGIAWDNAETVNQNGAIEFGTTTSGDSATIFNEAGATYDLATGDSQIYANGTGNYGFVNAGLLEMIGGGNNTMFVPLSNTGLVTANNGNLFLTGLAENSGTLQSNGGALFVEGGVLGGTFQDLGGNVFLIDTFTVAPGTTDDVVFGNAIFGDGGSTASLTGSGTLASTGLVSINQSGGNIQLVLSGGITWDNTGFVSQNGVLQYDGAATTGATIVNQAGATWDLTSGNSQLTATGAGTYSFVNDGLLEDNGGGTDTLSVPLSNAGLVTANNGTFILAGAVGNSGTLQANGGALYIDSGVLGGTIQVNPQHGGNVYLQGTYTSAAGQTDTVTFGGATLGDGNVPILAGPGTLVTNGSVNVNQNGGNVQLQLTGGLTWYNAGSVIQAGAVQLGTAGGDSATIVNEAGATWTLTSGNSQLYANGTGNYSYVNDGTMTDAGGGTDPVFVPLTNAGLLSDNNGTFVLAGGFANSGTMQTGGGNIVLGNGTLGGSILASDGAINLQGIYTSAADTTDTVMFGGATFGDGAIATLAGPGTLVSSGAVTVNHSGGNVQLQLTGGITWENYGALTQGGGIEFGLSTGDSATLVNEAGAVMNLNTGDSQIVTGAAGNYVLVNAGLMEDTGGGTNNVDVAIDETSTGTISNTNGNWNFNAGGDIAGQVTGGSQINFDGGNFTLAATGDITASNVAFNAGTLYMQGGTLNVTNLALASGVEATGYGAIGDLSNNALIDAAGGLLTVNGNVTGSGGLQIETGATLEITGSTGQNVTFDGIDATLKLDAVASFTGTIEDFGAGDTIDLGGVTLSAVSIQSGHLIGTLAAGGTLSLPTPGVSAGLLLSFAGDNDGGTDVFLSPAPDTAVPAIDTVLGTGNSITLPNVHVAGTANDELALSISNAATAPADGLDVATGARTGSAFDGGTIASLAPGLTDGSSIVVGLNNTSAGAKTGSVGLAFATDGGVSGIDASLGTETLNLKGAVYRYAAPSIAAPANVTLHVGDDGGTASEALSVSNTAAADGYSEGLDAGATGAVTGNLLSATGTTPDIAAGASNNSALTVSFSTASAGIITGDAAVAETSDGSGVDTLGTTSLGTVEVPVTVTIDSYATAAVQQASGPGMLSAAGNTYTLDLGTVAIGPGEVSDTLNIANTASGPADWLVGSVTAGGDIAFSDIGLGVGTVVAGASSPVAIDLSTVNAGVFSQTLTLVGNDANASGFSEALTAETVVVTGTVLADTELAQAAINEPSPIVLPDAHVASLVANDQTTLDISNIGSAQLAASVVSATGDAYGSGSFTGLAPGGTDATDILAGLNNTSAGTKSGTVTLAFESTGTDTGVGANIVTNGNFALGMTGWSSPDTYHSGAAASGSHGITAYNGDANYLAFGAVGEDIAATQTLATVAGDNYQVQFWYYSSGNYPSDLNVYFGSDDVVSLTDAPPTGWTEYTAYAQATSDNTVLSLAGRNDPSWDGLDDVSVIDVTGTNVALAPQPVSLEGSVYRYASPSISGPGNIYLHVGDGGGSEAAALVITNNAATDGFSENLDATAVGVAGGSLTGVSGSALGVTAGATNTSALTFSFSTAHAGNVSGSVAVAEVSDGSGVDTLGTTALGTVDVSVSVTVNNYATAAVEQANNVGALTLAGSVYALDLGTFAAGVAAPVADLDIENAVTGPADFLSGSISAGGDAAFGNTGLGTFGDLSAGGTSPFTVDLSAATPGVFTQTITINATDSNPGGYDAALTAETIEVTATVLPLSSLAQATIDTATPIVLPDAHVATSGTTDSTTLSIGNTGSAVLSGVVSGATGSAYGSGSIDQLAIGGTAASNITVGLNDSSAGAKTGTVTLGFSSGGDNLLTDGSFENTSDFDPPNRDTMDLTVGSTVMPGWTVAGGEPLAWVGPGNPFDLSAYDGSYFLDLTGDNDGGPFSGVSQIIATTSGDEYQLTFDLGSSSYYGLPAAITATAGGTSQTFTSTLTGTNNWQTETLDFTAAGNTTTISLVGASGENYIGLDDVSATSITTPTPVALSPQSVALSGNVYNLASASVTAPANIILHVGDDGGLYTEALTVQNTAPAGIYSEGLEVSAVGGAGGSVTGATGTTGDVAAGNSDNSSLNVTFSTAAASTGGEVAVSETSDGSGIDSLGTTALGTVDVPVGISINNFATAAMEFLGGNGTLTPTGVANTYTLNLGSTEQFSGALSADLGALNAAAGPAADMLDGGFSIGGDSVFSDTGFGAFNNVAFGNNAGGNDVVLNTGTIGTFTQQITLTASGTNASGYSNGLGTETIDVVGTIVPVPPPPPPPLPVATVWGDVHITTFDGLYYNFQAEGEFVLAQSTVAGDSFQVQGRMQPWSEGATVSVLTMLGAEVGTDTVTFGLDRTDVVWVDGVPQNLVNGQTITLSGGTVTQVSSASFQVNWNTGESMQVTDAGSYLNMNLTLAATDGPGSVQGLLGSDTGQANDFQLADGTVLAQPLASSQLYGEFANAWRVTSGAGGNSLLDYLSGQGTSTFTDVNFPTDAISVTSLPAAIVQEAELEVQQAGITDPNLAAAAVVDLLVTGDPTALLNDLNVNQTGETTQAAVINTPPPPVPALGVSANAANVVENADGTTNVTFTAYLTSASGTDTVIDWAVTAPDATFLNAGSFGGTLPSGFVTVPAGQTTTQFTVTLPAGVLGSAPSSNLQVSISSTNGDPIFGHTAQSEIDNNQPVAGNPAVPQLTLASGPGVFAGSGGNFTLNLGTLVAGEGSLQDRFQFANAALAPADFVGGSIAASGSGFTVYGAQPLTPLSAGASYQGLVVQTNSGATGPQSETIVISPMDENITGYSSILPAETIVITDTVLPAAVGELLTGGPINLGTFYEGEAASVPLSLSNAAASGSAGLDVSASSSGNATSEGTVSALAPGGTIDNAVFAGIDTSSPGVKTGTVTLTYASDAGDGNTSGDGSAQITVEGTVYGPAAAALTSAPIYVHRGDDGGSVTVAITVSNTAAADGFTEKLDAQVVNFGTYVTAASGSVTDLAPGISNDTSLSATLSDGSLGTYSGEVQVALRSDGTGIDNEGTTSLGNAYVQATVNVDQYAVAAIEQTGGNGTLVPAGVASSYVLDLGSVAQYATPLGASLAVLNDVLGTSDLLAGSFSLSGAPEFENNGFGAFGSGTTSAGLEAQQTDSAPFLVLSSGTVGTFSETITLDPTGYNPSGYSGALTPETVTVTGTVVAAPVPTPAARVADAWGDVHLTTFDGLYYNFQAAGEFVLSQSTVPGDTFAIQARMQPWNGSSSVSVNTMVAAEIGNDRVTFGIGRTDVVWIDGAGVSLAGNPVITLADGSLEQTSADSYRLVWNTGEELDITDDGTYLNATVSLPNSDAGNVQGLLGNDDGNPNNDLALPNGTSVATDGSVSYAELYGQYESAWQVTGATSLMDYQAGQDAASFSNVNFPYNQVGLGNLPADAVQQALAAAEAAGITDPNLQQAAIIDYLFTGNPQALQASENVQQQQGTVVTSGSTLTAAPAPTAVVGVQANVASVVESTSGAEAVGFTVYLTSPEASAAVIDYSVNVPGAGFLNAADFPGDILPSGTVTIAAGQTSAVFTVALPADVLGSAADANLQVEISPQNLEQGVFAPFAQTEVLNAAPTAGNAAVPDIEGVSGNGDLSGSGTSYVLNLGTVEEYGNPLEAGWGVLNGATAPADLLSGSFVVNGPTQFLNSGLAPFTPVAAGNADTAPVVEMLTNSVGTFTETVTLSPTDSNDSGYSAALNTVTLTVTGTVLAPPAPPPPPVPEATAWGDVHLTTFDGLYYNFQAAGEYVLTKSTIAGDTFQVQTRLQPYGANASVSVQTEIGAQVGSDNLVFAVDESAPFYLNGTADALSIGQTVTLAGGSVTDLTGTTYRVNWDTGETMNVTLAGSYINDTIALTAADAGNVQGLLGPDDGNPSTDLQLANGTPLIATDGTIASSEVYGAYATAWSVPSAGSSLLYYGGGESFGGFDIPGFPDNALELNQLPANLVAAAEAQVEAEGITNPNLIDAAVIDLLVTGNANSVFASENVQQQGVNLNGAAVSIPTPLPSVGIFADSATALAPATGTLAVDYTVYLTAAEANATTIEYDVTTPGANYLGAGNIVGGAGSGAVQIAAGQTSAQIVIDVLANALGSQPNANLQVSVTPTGGESVFGGSAQTEIVNPTPTAGNPAVPLVEQLGGDGYLTGSGTTYVLNLGTQVQNGTDLFANLGIDNGATLPADDLSGQFGITNFTGYLNTGFVPFSNVAPGAADTEPVVTLNTGTIGVFTETVVLDPTDTNPSGYSAPLNDVTLTVTGTIVPMPLPPPPSVPTATAWGDVHITTFDGLLYNFQAVGEFTLAKSTLAGDNFNVQIRTKQWSPGAAVSVIDQVAAGIDPGDSVTFGLLGADRTSTVELNGTAYAFSGSDVLTLAGGSVTEESSSTYVVKWNTGESLTVSLGGSYINTSVALAPTDGPGSVEGLLGSDSGVDTDFEPVVSGTTITTGQLYGAFAQDWSVTQATSLLNYVGGETHNNLTDLAFPSDALSLSDLPGNLQQEGLQAAIQAGITDPQLQQAAALDYIVTGDPTIVTGGENVQQQGITTTGSNVQAPAATPALGVSANNAALVEPASGNLAVGFTVYLTQAEANATTVDYAVTAPDAAYLGASAFAGDVLPSGTVTIAAGQTSANFSVSVPANVLGSLPSGNLQVTIAPTGGEPVFAPSAQTTIVNDQVEPGTGSSPAFALLSGEGTLTEIGNAYTVTLGAFTLGQVVQNLGIAVENNAVLGSDDLAGTLTATTTPGFTVSGTGPLPEIAAGTGYQGLHVAVNTGAVGGFTETIALTSVDQNASGYTSDPPPLSLTISGEVVSSVDLTPGENVFSGSNTTLIATGGVFQAGQTIAVTGSNLLELQGPGVFDLRAPAVLQNIQTVDVQAAADGQQQFIWLRSGLDVSLNVLDDANIVVFGATDSDVINLGAGTAQVTLGSGTEMVNGGSGNDTFAISAATAGATIAGGSGSNVLDVTGGGTLAMSGSITGIGNVFLENSGTAYHFAANSTHGLIVHAGADNATITPGDASQTVFGWTGELTVLATTAESGAAVYGSSGGATLEITNAGTVTLNAGDTNLAVQLAANDTLTLPFNPSISVQGGGGDDTLIVTGNVLRGGQTIAPGGTGNTLLLEGTGGFDLRAPAVLTNIQTVDAEGASSGQQFIWLRNGQALTLNVEDSAQAVVTGAADSDTINLGSGASVVYLGSAGETVNGGGGSARIIATAANIGATIAAGSGNNILEIEGGGTLTMGANITGIDTVFLDNAGTAYDFTANSTHGLIIDAGADNATIAVGDTSQSVYGWTGGLTVLATAADAGAAVYGSLGGATLEVTNSGTVVLNALDTNVVVELAAGDTMTLPFNPSISVQGGGGDDTLIVAANVLRAGQTIAPGGTGNTLLLQGPGEFDLTAPAVFSNIQTVDVAEGQFPNRPEVFLRNGTTLTVDVLADTSVNAGNPNPPGVVIFGAANSDTVNLGPGSDVVYVGGSGETFNGSSGNAKFLVTAATVGARIAGGSGTNVLEVQGGGTLTMGGNITGISDVFLDNAGTNYGFTANTTENLTIFASSDSDTITVGDASQTVVSTGGALTVLATAAQGGVAVLGGNGTILQITNAGAVALNASDINVSVELAAGDTLTLPFNPSISVQGGGGDDTLVVGGNILRSGQTIAPGGTGNTVVLDGSGAFNLAAPTMLSNIQTVDVQGASVGQLQLVSLRAGEALALDVQDTGHVVIFGAADSDTINLGPGSDMVYVGSNDETIDGGSGGDKFVVTAATIGATITGGSGANVLEVQDGGTLAMGSNITGINQVFLDNAGTSYNFTANNQTGLTIFASTDNDTITVGDASQTVVDTGGTLQVLATATHAGVAVLGGTGSSTLEITTGGTFALNSGDSNVTVRLDAASTLTLNHMQFIHAVGSGGNATIYAGAANQVLSGGGGLNDTLDDVGHYGVTFQDTVANFANDTLADFTKLDSIDVTNLNSALASAIFSGTSASGMLNVMSNGSAVVSIKLSGTISGTIHTMTDNHSGTLITFT
ncbi:MAG TPA: VWD domain-containing protein [Acetobacteraceae bacterium]|jgi:hypothetical protein